jgi:hypothetical protein
VSASSLRTKTNKKNKKTKNKKIKNKKIKNKKQKNKKTKKTTKEQNGFFFFSLPSAKGFH